MPANVQEAMPELYEQEKLGNSAVVYVKFFLPGTGWSWFATEFDPLDRICFGYAHNSADPQNAELGYFSLTELEEIRAGGLFRVERDLNWSPISIREVKERLAVGAT
ncbi:MAG: hypothetical protein QOE51_1605 [Actinoplanes sp.]|jgi:hypothetical protein|nr:hypothetical protein [Actinoplanes sp.]